MAFTLALAAAMALAPVGANWRGSDEREAIDGCTCHYFEASPAVQVALGGLPAVYLDGQSYDLRVEVVTNVTRTAAPQHLAGFQLQTSAGEFEVPPGQGDVRLGAQPPGSTSYTNRQLATQSPNGTNQTNWTVTWRAPDPGPPWNVTFWLAAMGVNGDGLAFWPDEWQRQTYATRAVDPRVEISSPLEGQAVAGVAQIAGNATPAGKVRVHLTLDGQGVGDVEGAGAWSFALDTRGRADGVHNLTAVPNVGMRAGAPALRQVVVSNEPPTVRIDAPAAGTQVVGAFAASGTADDPSPQEQVERVELALGDPALGAPWQAASGGANWSATLNSTVVGDGVTTLFARAFNGVAWGPATSVDVQVLNGNLAPAVEIEGPPNGTFVREDVRVFGSAADDGAVVAVEFSQDGGPWSAANGTDPWSFHVSARGGPAGPSLLLVRAFDGTSYSAARRLVLVLAPNRPPTLDLAAPSAGALFGGPLSVAGSGDDDSPSWWVLVRVDGVVVANVTGAAQWNVTILPAGLAPGAHRLTVSAHDGEFESEAVNRTLVVPSPPATRDPVDLTPVLVATASVAAILTAAAALRVRARAGRQG